MKCYTDLIRMVQGILMQWNCSKPSAHLVTDCEGDRWTGCFLSSLTPLSLQVSAVLLSLYESV